MDLIIKNLYLGDMIDGQEALNKGGFSVLSIGVEFDKNSTEMMIPLVNKSNCNWNVIPLWDGAFGISKHLKEVWDFIDKNIHEKVLVHCMAGQSRSVSFVWSYLLVKKGLGPLAAYLKIKEARPKVDPSPIFLNEILSVLKFNQEDISELIKEIGEINGR